MIKHLLTATSLLICFGLLASCDNTSDSRSTGNTQKNLLRIGVEGAYPPFSKINKDGKLEGFDIDIANALCTEINVSCELITQDWDGIIPGLIAKKYDAIIASMSITDSRKKKVAFTQPYYHSPARFIHAKKENYTISKSGLAEKSIGVQRGTVSDKFITATFGNKVDVKRYNTQEEIYLDLEAGRINLAFADAFVLLEFLNSEKGHHYKFTEGSYSDPEYFGEGIGIAIRKEDKQLLEQLNTAISDILDNGTYHKIRTKYFDFDIYKK